MTPMLVLMLLLVEIDTFSYLIVGRQPCPTLPLLFQFLATANEEVMTVEKRRKGVKGESLAHFSPAAAAATKHGLSPLAKNARRTRSGRISSA